MLKRSQYLVLMLAAVLVLLLVVFSGWLVGANRTAQAELMQRQQYVQQTVPLEALYRDIVKALAETAVKSNDRQVLDMLASQGLSVTVNAPAGAR